MEFRSKLIPTDIPEYLPKMLNLYEDLFSGGKNYRGHLVSSISEEMGLLESQAEVLSRVIEFIHNSSLLHDDIVDKTPLRRGKEAAWNKYGSGYAVLSGDYLLARVIRDLCTLENLSLVYYTSESILSLVEGEWLQDDCHGKTNVTLEQMDKVHKLKTSSLFSWCFKAPALLKGGVSQGELLKLEELGCLLGTLLQRSDDLLDFNIRNFENKPYFRDSVSGYFNSFMIFILEGRAETEKEKEFVFNIKSLGEFTEKFDINLTEKLQTFDQMNIEIFDRIVILLDQIQIFSKDFKEELKDAADKIYWRK